ncbi:MAG: ABC transporter ATP-binding protein [Alphaproteobacteria bacterium]|nr:ABC transporter ATP-binding protein [Alphaproteobacteria bacterium]
MTALAVNGLKVAYGPVVAVHDLSFRLEPGESVSLLGPNGAGKTSAVEAIAGLLPKAAGNVMLGASDISRLPASAVVKKGLALVPQWRELFPTFSVEETLLAGANGAGGRTPRPLAEIYDLFPILKERRSQAAGSLSGGEQQMLAIGRALVTAPSVLLLDEPSAGLAVGVVKVLVEILGKIRATGVSILLVEQKLDIAQAVTERSLVLSVGQVSWTGPITEASHLDEIRRAYFT